MGKKDRNRSFANVYSKATTRNYSKIDSFMSVEAEEDGLVDPNVVFSKYMKVSMIIQAKADIFISEMNNIILCNSIIAEK
jgi:hypothetical protein